MTRALPFALILLFGCASSSPEDPSAAKSSAKPTDAAKPAAAKPSEPAPVLFEAEDGMSGYRDAEGKIVIPAQFPMAMPFEGEVAGVVAGEGWMFIDRTGRKLATAFNFDNGPDAFVEDRARIVDADKYGFIAASSGKIVIAPTWSFALPFAGGLAAVCEGCVREQDGDHFTMKGGKWGYIDLAGEIVIAPRFDQAEPFAGGRASVREGERRFVIGPEGSELK